MDTDNNQLRRLYFRSSHRGCKETDLLLGDFAEKHLAGMDAQALSLYEALIEEPDWDIWAWANGQEDYPPRYAPLIARLRERG
jgi:antitoxin CptB